jgi:hypothetical protein
MTIYSSFKLAAKITETRAYLLAIFLAHREITVSVSEITTYIN